jgi:hypothetical protein
MHMLEQCLPIKTFRGTLAEVLSHQEEIPRDSIVECRVYAPAQLTQEPTLADSLAELLLEASGIRKGEPTVHANPRKKAVSEAIAQKLQRQGLPS